MSSCPITGLAVARSQGYARRGSPRSPDISARRTVRAGTRSHARSAESRAPLTHVQTPGRRSGGSSSWRNDLVGRRASPSLPYPTGLAAALQGDRISAECAMTNALARSGSPQRPCESHRIRGTHAVRSTAPLVSGSTDAWGKAMWAVPSHKATPTLPALHRRERRARLLVIPCPAQRATPIL
jgi:hypothetical protein